MREARKGRWQWIWYSWCRAFFDAVRRTKFTRLRPPIGFAASLAATALLAGCASELNRKAQHADGLIDFAFALGGREHKDIAPVEVAPGRSAEITSVHAVADRGEMLVHGYVQRIALVSPGYGAHVDVLLIGADGKTLAHASDKYSSTMLSHRHRGGSAPRAVFTARLPRPPAGARVRIIHDGAPLSECALNTGVPEASSVRPLNPISIQTNESGPRT